MTSNRPPRRPTPTGFPRHVPEEQAGQSHEARELSRAWRALMKIKNPSTKLMYLRAALRERIALISASGPE